MKKKKILLSVLAPMMCGMVGCKTGNNINSSLSQLSSIAPISESHQSVTEDSSLKETNDNSTLTLDSSVSNSLYTNDGYLRFTNDVDDDMVSTIISNLISKGGEVIAGGIQTYAKSIVLNLLKECGFDFRDATTKTLEKIQEQLTAIEEKIDTIAAKEEKHYDEQVLNPLLNTLDTAQINYVPHVVHGLGYLAELENDETITEPELEAKRKEYFENSVSKIMINGSPFANYVTSLADSIYMPNPSDATKDIFYYYGNTLGIYDVWTSLKIRNIKNFMAYIDSTLIACANLAKFQMYYITLGMDEATIRTYSDMMDKMAIAVNRVNEFFKKKLESMKDIEDKLDNGINVYIPTGKEYSTRMATLTYNPEDKDGMWSRQALLMDGVDEDEKHTAGYKAYSYKPNQDIISAVVSDYKHYADSYCVSTYTIQDYLKFAGFHANHEDLFDQSVGLYNGEFYADCHGFLYDDVDYSISYYNEKGDYTRKTIYKVCSYHDWSFNVVRTTIENTDQNYYLCFAVPRGSSDAKLDGIYEEVNIHDHCYTINNALYYRKYYSDIKLHNESGWGLEYMW
jgi:hypothetical protein